MSTPTTLAVFGAPGQGKTAYLRAALRERHIHRFAAVDPWGELPGDDVYEGAAEAVAALDAIPAEDQRAVSVLVVPRADEERAAAAALATCCYRIGAVLLVDEAHTACGVNDCPGSVRDLARRGRHVGGAVWVASQRPADVSRTLTAGGERVFFWLDEPRDLQYVRATVGAGAEELVRKLAVLHYLYRYGRRCYLGRVVVSDAQPPRTELVREVTDEELR